MKKHTIQAIFRGQNGSLGYETKKEYTLYISQGTLGILISGEEGGACVYETITGFLENWDCIRLIKTNV